MTTRLLTRLIILAAGPLLLVPMAVPANAASHTMLPANKQERLSVEKHLNSLGLPVGKVNGTYDAESRKGFCAWRELTGRHASTKPLTSKDVTAILATTKTDMVPTDNHVTGLNVNKTCQVLVWVTDPKDGPRKIKGVFKVSSGMSGHTTPSGNFHITRQLSGWHESTKYAGAMMYRPKYFLGGIALHGSYTDSLVLPYPASHGCVRMLHRDVDKLWAAHVNPGTPVRVYGTWRG